MALSEAEERELFGRWIAPNPHSSDAADALVLPWRVSAWVIIGQLKLDYRKAELVAAQYELPIEAVQAAAVYYGFYQEHIDARISANRSFFTS
jgi:uncharacterized protein (DUF433 family)